MHGTMFSLTQHIHTKTICVVGETPYWWKFSFNLYIFAIDLRYNNHIIFGWMLFSYSHTNKFR